MNGISKKLVPQKYPNNCCSILKATDAGLGVRVTNTEVRFRDIETARMHSSDRVNRITMLQVTQYKMKQEEPMRPLERPL